MSGITKAARITRVWMAALASLIVLAAQDLAAQDLAASAAVLRIAVISGEGAIHAPGEHVAKPVTVQVTDGTGRPVEGARVSFQLPAEGPGGIFSSGLGTDLAITGAGGSATVRSLQFNRIAGRCLIRVTAAKGPARAGIVVPQYINDPTSARESANRATPLAVSEKTSPAAASSAAPPRHPPASATLEVAPAAPIPPRKAQEPTPLIAAIQPSKSTGQVADGAAPVKSARIPTIIIAQGSGKPVPGAMAGGGYTSPKNGSHKKWIWLGILAAGGVAGAFAGSSIAAGAAHNSAGAAAVVPPVTIGAPAISIGKP